MDPKQITYLNIALFVVIVGLSGLVVFPKPAVPAVDDLSWLDNQIAQPSSVDTSGSASAVEYPAFGRVNLFETIIPRPTPEPTPEPTPRPDIPIAEIVSTWEIKGALRSMAIFADTNTREEWTMQVGDTRMVNFKGSGVRIKLESTGSGKVQLSYEGNQGRQEIELSLWGNQ
ncbi:MAG: hypothetical protein SF028_04900 [Candidatus Sumerlaeia bacterium]|nr:hypothetical protein [Candidatus Sumerlaeia bacterium]